MKKQKALTLIELIVSIGIISLLLTIIIQTLLVLSKYNKKVGYVQEADIKIKQTAIKIERILYDKGILNLRILDSNVLQIYSVQGSSTKTLVELYYRQEKINKKNYRKVVIYFDKTNTINFAYLPDNVFWKIEDFCVLRSTNNVTTTYLYNFENNATNLIKIQTTPINRQRKYDQIIFQNLSISFYTYTSDQYGREFSRYIKDRNAKINKPLIVYLINIINLNP